MDSAIRATLHLTTHRKIVIAEALLVIAGSIASACGAIPQSPIQSSLPFLLVTSAPNPSPTPTPFQPLLHTPTQAWFSFSNSVSVDPGSVLPTETPSPTPTLPFDPSPTVDFNQLFPTAAAPPPAEIPLIDPTAFPPLTDNETYNVLLIGSDKRPGSSYRTDTLVIAIIWPKEGQVSLISIPRDLWIYIPSVGMQRINTAYQSGEVVGYAGGGPGLLRDTIAYNLGIRIDHTAMVEFDGFRRIVDTLDGIEVPISCAYTDWRLIDPSYDPFNENNWWLFSIGPGQVHMDGDLALWYARSRLKSNDFDRGRRQQEVLRALFQKALQTNTFSKIPQLYNDFSSTVVTDIAMTDMLRLAPYAVNFTNANIRGYYIRPPAVSSWITPGGASVLLPNEELLRQLLIDASTLSGVASQRKAITIEVQNGSPAETWDSLAASRLNYAGYQTAITLADARNYASSVLVDFTPGQDPNQQQLILSILGLYNANIITLTNPASHYQYRLILGSNYEPCFQPENLSH